MAKFIRVNIHRTKLTQEVAEIEMPVSEDRPINSMALLQHATKLIGPDTLWHEEEILAVNCVRADIIGTGEHEAQEG